MRSGASGSARRSCSSVSARLRALWSPARRRRWRMNSSLALRVTVSCRSRLSPRIGTRICTRDPRIMREPFLVGRQVLRLDRDEHLLRHAERRLVAVQLLEDAIDQAAGAELFDLVDHEALAPDDPALAHVEDLHRGLEVVVGEADHVDVFAALGDHLLLLDRPMHGRQPVADACRPLVLHRVRRGAHLGVEPLDDLVGVAVEEVAQLVDELAVVGRRRSRRRTGRCTSRCGTAGTAGRAAGAR